MGSYLEAAIEALADTAKLVPFLFITYLILESIEGKASAKTVKIIGNAGKAGPAAGALLGAVPLCGFSSAAANFYAGSVISRGTLIAVFVSTSDEMLPILISNGTPAGRIFLILGIKVLAGVAAGYLADLWRKPREKQPLTISALCEKANCECGEGNIFRAAAIHTLKITLFILAANLVLGLVIAGVGADALGAAFAGGHSVAAILIASVIGLVPNCGISVLFSELYLAGTLSFGAFIAGLCANAGVGLAVLAHLDPDRREVVRISAILALSGLAAGLAAGLLA